jgi:hypothetical protein
MAEEMLVERRHTPTAGTAGSGGGQRARKRSSVFGWILGVFAYALP